MWRTRLAFVFLVVSGCLALLLSGMASGFAQTPQSPEVTDLVQALNSTDAETRADAALKLGNMGSAAGSAADDLIAALEDTDEQVRYQATNALAAVVTSDTPWDKLFNALLPVLDDETDYVGGNAVDAIGTVANWLNDNAGSLSEPNLNVAIQQLKNVNEALKSPGSSRAQNAVASRDTGGRDATANVERAITRLTLAADKLAADNRNKNFIPIPVPPPAPPSTFERLEDWITSHKTEAGLAGYPLLVLSLNGLLLAFCPISILYLNNGLKRVSDLGLPPPLNSIKLTPGLVFGVGFLNYHPRVLDAWVKKYAPVARKHLDERRTFRDRRVYVNIPIDFPAGNKPPTPADFHPLFGETSAVVLLWGDGGSGKTTLACQMARWALADEECERLCRTHRIMPVFVEDNLPGAKPGDSAALLDIICDNLKQLIGEETAPSAELVKKLLERRRILLIVDGFSELNPETQAVIRPNMPALPINALLVTSRDENSLKIANPRTLRTGLLKGQGIAAFVEDYIQQEGKRALFTDAEFYEEITRFTKLVGNREITALLAGLYARHILDRKENHTIERPQNVPEFMDAYVDEMCRRANVPSYPIEVVAPLAYKIAWHCLQDTLTPTETPLAEVTAALTQTNDGIMLPADQSDPSAVITVFVDKLRLLRRQGITRSGLKFTLDPLAEYLAARYVVAYRCRNNAAAWDAFFAEAEARPNAPQAIVGFLRALEDTLTAKGHESKAPEYALPNVRRMLQAATAPAAPVILTASSVA